MKNKLFLLLICLISIVLFSGCERSFLFYGKHYNCIEELSNDNVKVYMTDTPPYNELKIEKQSKAILVTYNGKQYKISGSKDNAHITLDNGRAVVVKYKYNPGPGSTIDDITGLDFENKDDIDMFFENSHLLSDLGNLIYDLKAPWEFEIKKFINGLLLLILSCIIFKYSEKLCEIRIKWVGKIRILFFKCSEKLFEIRIELNSRTLKLGEGGLVFILAIGFILGGIGVILLMGSFL